MTADEPRDATGDTAGGNVRNALQLVRITRADIDAALAAIDARLVAALQLLETPRPPVDGTRS